LALSSPSPVYTGTWSTIHGHFSPRHPAPTVPLHPPVFSRPLTRSPFPFSRTHPPLGAAPDLGVQTSFLFFLAPKSFFFCGSRGHFCCVVPGRSSPFQSNGFLFPKISEAPLVIFFEWGFPPKTFPPQVSRFPSTHPYFVLSLMFG